MILQIVAVRDRAMDAYMRPFFVPALGMAMRSFQDEVNRVSQDNPMYRHPEDYDLYHLGEFEEETGKFTSLASPKQLAIGRQMVNPKGE